MGYKRSQTYLESIIEDNASFASFVFVELWLKQNKNGPLFEKENRAQMIKSWNMYYMHGDVDSSAQFYS